ncbi:MAG: sulfatase, partial [Gemmatimonadetes bacterium]|nr:sulfatase [Gemmatimonadota bacterium]
GQEGPAGTTGSAAAPPNAPNIVIITIDTFRTDFLGAYGNPHVYTPHMDRFARGGTQMLRALSSIPITLPSHATLMTGTHPATHGIYNNGFAFAQPERNVLAGHLRALGYRTAAFVSAFPLHDSFGLSAGFDVYDDETDQATFLSQYQFRKFLNESSTGAILKRQGRPVLSHRVAERAGEGVWNAAREWLDAEGDQPFFLWLHFYDPHAPYAPGEVFEKLYAERTVLGGGYELADIEVPVYARLKHASDMATYRALYAGEVTRIDRVIGEMSAYFDKRDWTERTLFALTSDHGEGLGSHDVLVHTPRIYEEQTSVPLFMRGPGIEPGALSKVPVRLVDLAPTLLAFGSLPPLPETDGRIVHIAEGSEDSEFLHVAETPVDGGRRSIENGEWKLIHALQSDSYELFRHADDPGETRDRIADREADGAFRALRDLLATIPTGLGTGDGGDPEDLPEAAREKLRGLGYLNDD